MPTPEAVPANGKLTFTPDAKRQLREIGGAREVHDFLKRKAREDHRYGKGHSRFESFPRRIDRLPTAQGRFTGTATVKADEKGGQTVTSVSGSIQGNGDSGQTASNALTNRGGAQRPQRGQPHTPTGWSGRLR